MKTFLRVLPTRWRRTPAATEMTSLSPYVYSPIYFTLFICQSTSRKEMHSFTRKKQFEKDKTRCVSFASPLCTHGADAALRRITSDARLDLLLICFRTREFCESVSRSRLENVRDFVKTPCLLFTLFFCRSLCERRACLGRIARMQCVRRCGLLLQTSHGSWMSEPCKNR